MATKHDGVASKPTGIHLESFEDKDNAQGTILKSQHDNVGLIKTVWRFRKAVFICNLLCIAAAADGYQIVLSGNIIANQGFVDHVGFLDEQGTYMLNANYTALWGAMQSLGQLIGMVILNPMSDRIGRKMTLYTLWVMLLASLLLETFVRNWKDWTVARILGGIGIGAIQATLPVYISEWAPANIRGGMVLTYGLWNSFGKFLPPMVLYIVERDDPLNYKLPILTQWAFLGVMLPIFMYLPETPAYFAALDQDDKGKAALQRVNGKVEGYNVNEEYAIIRNTVVGELQSNVELRKKSFKELLQSYLECFKGTNLWRTIGSSLPICSQQLTGLAFLNTYASLFFKQAGFDDAFLITTILTAISLLTSIVLVLTSDRLGRRVMVLASSTSCTITMMIVAILGLVPQTNPLKILLISVACIWSFFSNALGGLGWTFVGEVASQNLRARTAGLAAGSSVLLGLTFNTAVPVILDSAGANWGYQTGWLFFVAGVVVSILVYFFVPETSKRNAAELDEMFAKGIPAWRTKGFVTDVQKDWALNVN